MSIVYHCLNSQIAFYLFVIAVLLASAAVIWQFRRAPGAKMQFYNMFCKGIWLLSIVLFSVENGLEKNALASTAIHGSHSFGLLMACFYFAD